MLSSLGVFPLQFFERVCWEESDLNIWVQTTETAEELGMYIKAKEGYKYAGVSFTCKVTD